MPSRATKKNEGKPTTLRTPHFMREDAPQSGTRWLSARPAQMTAAELAVSYADHFREIATDMRTALLRVESLGGLSGVADRHLTEAIALVARLDECAGRLEIDVELAERNENGEVPMDLVAQRARRRV
jgi:hypothetical protein